MINKILAWIIAIGVVFVIGTNMLVQLNNSVISCEIEEFEQLKVDYCSMKNSTWVVEVIPLGGFFGGTRDIDYCSNGILKSKIDFSNKYFDECIGFRSLKI